MSRIGQFLGLFYLKITSCKLLSEKSKYIYWNIVFIVVNSVFITPAGDLDAVVCCLHL